MELAAGEGNNADLATHKTRCCRGGGDEETAHVRKPARLEIIVIFGDGRLLHGAAGDVDDEESTDILGRRLDDGDHDSLAIGGPGKREAIRQYFLMMKEFAFQGAVGPRNL